MQLSAVLLAFLGTLALAVPNALIDSLVGTKNVATRVNASQHSPAELDKCDAIFNCETYDHPKGTRIRVRAGYEPGSTLFNAVLAAHAKRDGTRFEARDTSCANTSVTIGDESMDWGTTIPQTSIYNTLPAICGDSQCIGTTASSQTNFASQISSTFGSYYVEVDSFITISATGFYPPGSESAMQILLEFLAGFGNPQPTWELQDGTILTTNVASTYLGANIYDICTSPETISANIAVDISNGISGDAFCNSFAGLSGALVAGIGLINPVFGGVGGIGAGLLAGFCGASLFTG